MSNQKARRRGESPGFGRPAETAAAGLLKTPSKQLTFGKNRTIMQAKTKSDPIRLRPRARQRFKKRGPARERGKIFLLFRQGGAKGLPTNSDRSGGDGPFGTGGPKSDPDPAEARFGPHGRGCPEPGGRTFRAAWQRLSRIRRKDVSGRMSWGCLTRREIPIGGVGRGLPDPGRKAPAGEAAASLTGKERLQAKKAPLWPGVGGLASAAADLTKIFFR